MPVVLVGEYDIDGIIVNYKVFVSTKILFRGADVNEALFYWVSAHYVFHLETDNLPRSASETTYTLGKKNPKEYEIKNRITCTLHIWGGYMLRIQNALSRELTPKDKKAVERMGEN